MFDRTKIDQNCPRLTKAERAAIPSANDDPRILELQQKRLRLQAEFKDLTNQLNGDYRYSPEKQQQAIEQLIASGILPEGTTSISPDIVKEGIINRRDVLQNEITKTEQDIRMLHLAVVQENSKTVAPIAKKMNAEIIHNAKALRESILRLNELYWALLHKGNTTNLRPQNLQPMPWEHCIIYGGYAEPMESYLTRKENLFKEF